MSRFHEIQGNLWDYVRVGNVVVITTNGVRNRYGYAVMGAGVAKQARDRFPGIAKRLGSLLAEHGLQVEALPMGMAVGNASEWTLVAFPTKVHWREPSSLDLIARSAAQLEVLATRHDWQDVYLPRPGVGNGGLRWEDVLASGALDCLDERFTVVYQ